MQELGPFHIVNTIKNRHLCKLGFNKMVLCHTGEESFDFMTWVWESVGPGMTINQFYTSEHNEPPAYIKWIIQDSDFIIHESIVELVILRWS